MLKDNLGLKFAALVIAMTLWNRVASEGDVLKTLQVPLELSGLPADREIVGTPIDDVTVRLRGPEIALRTLSPERVRLPVNLGQQPLQLGRNLIPLSTDAVRAPSGVTVDRLSPAVLELFLEESTSRELPVEPEIRGQPAPGYEVAGIVVTPPRLFIEGPAPAVMEVESLSTPAISIDGQTETQRLKVRPFAAGPAGGLVRLAAGPAQVEVVVMFRPITVERILRGVAVMPEGVPAGWTRPQFMPETVDVKVSGPQVEVEKLTPESLRAVINLAAPAPAARQLGPPDFIVRPARPGAAATGLHFEITAPAAVSLSWPPDARN